MFKSVASLLAPSKSAKTLLKGVVAIQSKLI